MPNDAGVPRARSKTVATWLAFLGGSLGLHRFYLHGARDVWGWLLIPPTLVGLWGVQRMRALGQDDVLAWFLVPWLGLTFAITMLEAIVYGLTPRERWQARHDAGRSTRSWPWLDVIGVVGALAVGAIVLIATIAFVAQRTFESLAPAQSKSQRLAP